MKKYVKPDLYFESFQLNQHIAGCAFDMVDFRDPDTLTCYSHGDEDGEFDFIGRDIKYFVTNGVCHIEPQQYCYVTASDEYPGGIADAITVVTSG